MSNVPRSMSVSGLGIDHRLLVGVFLSVTGRRLSMFLSINKR